MTSSADKDKALWNRLTDSVQQDQKVSKEDFDAFVKAHKEAQDSEGCREPTIAACLLFVFTILGGITPWL